ncbi:MAG: DUF371 domain-containing protein [Candidatus Nezhaarchaeales archaeon]|nr:MAG: DUF371 domain-containing protein [Candidatus Nezhaarchaeota archaeon WYZ-LMO8]TDA34483.1 MAG: DUF371 domain-containing protein [Candidatus Nezhaarchaeota archaeon WYZ-LMO7]
MVYLKETFHAWGHRNIRATHRTTLEITKEEHITPRGNCIVAVRSEKSVCDLSQELKQAVRHSNAKVTLLLRTLDIEDVITGFGSEKLPLTSRLSIVCRRSDYVCPRTLMIKCDKAAIDVNRELVNCLRMENRLQVTIEVVV